MPLKPRPARKASTDCYKTEKGLHMQALCLFRGIGIARGRPNTPRYPRQAQYAALSAAGPIRRVIRGRPNAPRYPRQAECAALSAAATTSATTTGRTRDA